MNFRRITPVALNAGPVPPLVDTPMTAGRGSNKMSAEAFVGEMLRQVNADRREIRVGQARQLMALNRLAPGLADWLTRRISRGKTQAGAGREAH